MRGWPLKFLKLCGSRQVQGNPVLSSARVDREAGLREAERRRDFNDLAEGLGTVAGRGNGSWPRHSRGT